MFLHVSFYVKQTVIICMWHIGFGKVFSFRLQVRFTMYVFYRHVNWKRKCVKRSIKLRTHGTETCFLIFHVQQLSSQQPSVRVHWKCTGCWNTFGTRVRKTRLFTFDRSHSSFTNVHDEVRRWNFRRQIIILYFVVFVYCHCNFRRKWLIQHWFVIWSTWIFPKNFDLHSSIALRLLNSWVSNFNE